MLIIYNLYGVRVYLDITLKNYRLYSNTGKEIAFHCFKEVNENLFIQISDEIKQFNRSCVSTEGTTGGI